MTNTPSHFSTSYNYQGEFKKRHPAWIHQQLAKLFGLEMVESDNAIPFHGNFTAVVVCAARKGARGFEDVKVNVEFHLVHIMNVCCFHFLRGFKGVEQSDRTQHSVASLARTLATNRDADHYKKMLVKG